MAYVKNTGSDDAVGQSRSWSRKQCLELIECNIKQQIECRYLETLNTLVCRCKECITATAIDDLEFLYTLFSCMQETAVLVRLHGQT